MSLRRILVLAVFATVAPLVCHAQNPCGAGFTYTPLPGGGYSCIPVANNAPEVGASSSIGGIAVLMGGIIMLRGRKRSNGLEIAPAANVAA